MLKRGGPAPRLSSLAASTAGGCAATGAASAAAGADAGDVGHLKERHQRSHNHPKIGADLRPDSLRGVG